MPRPRRILGLICARSGSRGLRDKNIQKLDGTPLLARAVGTLLECERRGEDWTLVVSTDSERYARIARRAGAETPFIRPRRLASARGRLIDAVLHAVNWMEADRDPYDLVVLHSAVSPGIVAGDIRRGIGLYRRAERDISVAGVSPDPIASSWRFESRQGVLDRTPRHHRVGRRQESRDRVYVNGSFYLASPRWLRRYGQFVRAGRTLGCPIPLARALDIDTPEDLALARLRFGGLG